jgi:hypothetical protein
LINVAPHLNGDMALCKRAMAAAGAVADKDSCARVLSAVAAHLSGEMRQYTLERALTAAESVVIEPNHTWALSAVAAQLTNDDAVLLKRTLATAETVVAGPYRVFALSAVAAKLSGEGRQKTLELALSAAEAITSGTDRATALSTVAEYLIGEEALLERALAAIEAIPDESDCSKALIAILQHLEIQNVHALWERLSSTLARFKRPELLRVLPSLVPLIKQLGGEAALEKTAQNIIEISEWWP